MRLNNSIDIFPGLQRSNKNKKIFGKPMSTTNSIQLLWRWFRKPALIYRQRRDTNFILWNTKVLYQIVF